MHVSSEGLGMGLSKEQVEKHIAGIQKRLTSAQEVYICRSPFYTACLHRGPCCVPPPLQRALHGYEFARLCVEVQNYQDAIR